MKLKLRTALMSILTFVLVLSFAAVSSANSDKDEAISYLNQAAQNTAKAQNFAYDVAVSLKGPLADFDIKVNGKYEKPFSAVGTATVMADLWIVDMNFNVISDYYINQENDKALTYMKMHSNLPTNPSNEFKDNQWYVQSVDLPKSVLDELNSNTVPNLENLNEDIKNIFMYKIDDDTSKLFVTYNKAFIDEKRLADLYSIKDTNLSSAEQKRQQVYLQEIKNNKALQKALFKPRNVTYEIVVDDKTMQIREVKSDMTDYLQNLGSEVLNAVPFEQYQNEENSYTSGKTVRNVLKNYLKRSSLTFDVKMKDIDTTPVEPVPQEVKDAAIAPPTVDSSGVSDEEQVKADAAK